MYEYSNNIIVSVCDKEMKIKRKRLNRHVNVTVCAVTTGEPYFASSQASVCLKVILCFVIGQDLFMPAESRVGSFQPPNLG